MEVSGQLYSRREHPTYLLNRRLGETQSGNLEKTPLTLPRIGPRYHSSIKIVIFIILVFIIAIIIIIISSHRGIITNTSNPKIEKVMTVTFELILLKYEGWNFNSGNYLFTTDTK